MDYIADVPLADGETFAKVKASFEKYSNRFVLSCKGQTCSTVLAHVSDPAVVIDVSVPGEIQTAVDVNGVSQIVPLTNGKGSFTIPTTKAGTYQVTPTDRFTYCAAGVGSLSVMVL